MATILLVFIYIFYIGLGIPDSLLGAAWPAIYLSVMLTPVLFSVVTTFAGISVFPNFLLIMFLLMIGCTIVLKIGDAKSRTKIQNV